MERAGLWRSVWRWDGPARGGLYPGQVPTDPSLLQILWCVIFGRARPVLPVWDAVDEDFGVTQWLSGCGTCRATSHQRHIPPAPHPSECPLRP